jgi:DNA-binding LacI/PurR family transcriptional regulator
LAKTIDELAELSGVSRATVSRVLNGGSVSPATMARVRTVLDREDYHPNAAARSLASGKSGVVGLVIHVDPHDLFQDRYFGQLLQGITDVLAEHATGMMLWLGNRSKEETLGRIRSVGLLDGVIVTANQLDDPLVDGLLASSLPSVLIGHRRADRTASYVDVDNTGAADVMTTHMIESGRRRIGHITGLRGTVAAEDRLAGYRRAMDRAGLPTDGLILDGDFNREAGSAGAKLLVERGVDAIFCANDAAAAGALGSIRASGRRVPDDVALGGFDDLDFAAELDPPLTTIRQGVQEQGAEAARMMLHLVGDVNRSPRRVLLPTELVIRRSTTGGAQRGTGGGDEH